MNIAKLKTLVGSCVYFLLIAFSVSVNAAEFEALDPGISVEGWSGAGGQEIPILSFDGSHKFDEIYDDIRAENVIRDKDGSIRFQLSHAGPMSRQVFANVRRVEQDNGLTRSIITNIADGYQTEYLTRTADGSRVKVPGETGEANFLAQLKSLDEQNTECPMCYLFGLLISEVACAASTSLAHYNCRINCRSLGGVQYFNSGVCGTAYSECLCWIAPKKINEEF